MSQPLSSQVNPISSPKPLHPAPSAHHSIPFDIFLETIKYLDIPDLGACLSVSREVYDAVLPFLYRNIRIDLARANNPILIVRRPVISPQLRLGKILKGLIRPKKEANITEIRIEDLKARGKEEERDEAIRLRQKKRTMIPESKYSNRLFNTKALLSPSTDIINLLPHPTNYIAHLTLSSHSREKCNTFDSLIIPHLHTLQIIPYNFSHSPGIYQCHGFSGHSTTCPSSPLCLCTLIARLTPHRLIIGSDTVGSTRPIGGLWYPLPEGPPVWLTEMVVYAGSVDGINIGPVSQTSWRNQDKSERSKFQKVTFILQPEKVQRRGEGLIDRLGNYWPMFELGAKIATALDGDPSIMEIVGMEDLNLLYARVSSIDAKKVTETAIKTNLVEKGWEEKIAKEKVEGIRWIKRSNYAGNYS